jgi:crotonobetainyl-CoA:carnitine CoA-transferase CaiB-like acyl-CoA transferase
MGCNNGDPIMAEATPPASHATVKPLQGIRVIDVSSFLAGPFCSTQLAEFGADVIKIELPKVGDALRKFGTITKSGDSLPWLQECRNKKSATLDLRQPEGAEILKRLVSQADVMGARLGRPAKAEPQVGDGPHLRLRPDRPL